MYFSTLKILAVIKEEVINSKAQTKRKNLRFTKILRVSLNLQRIPSPGMESSSARKTINTIFCSQETIEIHRKSF